MRLSAMEQLKGLLLVQKESANVTRGLKLALIQYQKR
jgi:hypothetical protein